jgi:hypothetical protein
MRNLPVKKLALLAFVLAANPAAAASMTTKGPSALALAAIVASHSRTLGAADRNVLARLFGECRPSQEPEDHR